MATPLFSPCHYRLNSVEWLQLYHRNLVLVLVIVRSDVAPHNHMMFEWGVFWCIIDKEDDLEYYSRAPHLCNLHHSFDRCGN